MKVVSWIRQWCFGLLFVSASAMAGFDFGPLTWHDFDANGRQVNAIVTDLSALTVPVAFDGASGPLGCQNFYWVQWVPAAAMPQGFQPQDVECEADPGIPGQRYDNLRCGGTDLSQFFASGRNVTREIKKGVWRDKPHFCFGDGANTANYQVAWQRLRSDKKNQDFFLIFFLPEGLQPTKGGATLPYIVGYRHQGNPSHQ